MIRFMEEIQLRPVISYTATRVYDCHLRKAMQSILASRCSLSWQVVKESIFRCLWMTKEDTRMGVARGPPHHQQYGVLSHPNYSSVTKRRLMELPFHLHQGT